MPTIDIQYFKEDSFVHRLHPFTKVVFEISVLVAAAAFNEPLFLAVVILAIMGVAALAKIPARKFRYMWVLTYIVLFMVITQGVWFTSFGDFGDIDVEFEWRTLFNLWPAWAPGGPRIPVIFEGANYGFSLGLRVVAISFAFPILVLTTHPSDLTRFLSQIRIVSWRIPYNVIFVFTTAFRYIPTVSREFDQTLDAQRSRGVHFGGFNPIRQIRVLMTLFVPVLTSSLLSAHDLTLALETRAFGAPTERTFIHEVHWRKADWGVTALLIIIVVVCLILANRYGLGVLPYTPQRNI
ncbi:MAG: energy-coupling factor transporter transmembrane component T [Caldilineaceae bacterium]|nr:energy-coupling factor transporter transmembrane component T [Caldilineaceae bacterium]